MHKNYPSSSLLVENLHHATTKDHLIERFSEAGPVKSVKLKTDIKTKKSERLAYVEFVHLAHAKEAYETINEKPIKGIPMKISYNTPTRLSFASNFNNGKLFIKNLDFSVNEDNLRQVFDSYGKIVNVKIFETAGKPNGHGLVQFETEEQANRANYEVDGTSLMGKYIKVEKFSSQQRMKSMHAKTKGTNLFVKNFGDKLDDDNLFSMFEVFGPVNNAQVKKDESGSSKGFGFVNMVNNTDAENAIDILNGKVIEAQSNKKLYVSKHQTKEERAAASKQSTSRALAKRFQCTKAESRL